METAKPKRRQAVAQEARRPPSYRSESDDSAGEEVGPVRRRAQKGANQSLVPVDNALGNVTNTATGLANTAGQTLQGATGQALSNQGGKNKDTLRLRLDLNLDVDITLKARIHGDLELALLN